MRAGAAFVMAVAVIAGCAGGDPEGNSGAVFAGERYPAENREAFLTACVDNAQRTSGGRATDAQLEDTCKCLLERFEDNYSLDEFKAIEQDLTAGTVDDEGAGRLLNWSTQCAREVAGR